MHVEVWGISIKHVVYNLLASFESCSFFSNLTLPLQAYDQHLNMILGDVEETVTTIEIDEETYEEIYKVSPAGLLLTVSDLIMQQLNTYS